MYTTDQVLQALIAFVRRNVSGCFVGVVTNTDKAVSEGLIEVESNDLTYEVRLQAITSESAVGVLLVPKVESSVFCAAEGNSENSFVVVSFNEVEAVKLTIEGATIDIDKDAVRLAIESTTIDIDKESIVFNGGKLGSLVVIQSLVNRLNTIEKAFNSLLNDYEGHDHTHPQGNTTGLLVPYLANDISETKVGDIENNKIKQ